MLLRKSKFLLYFFVFVFLLFVFYKYYERVGGFSFGDEWHNFTTAFFMLKGRMLYSEIFNNHQMLATYISFFIQKIFSPHDLYQLVLYHRLFIITFSFFMGILLVARFRFVGLAFVVFYESTKFYLFGHLFLPEALIVYPLVYLLGLAWNSLHGRQLAKKELIVSGILTWFVIFTREPFIPVAVILYAVILLKNKNEKKRKYLIISLAVIVILSLLIIASLWRSLSAYFFEVIQFNLTVVLPNEAKANGSGMMKSFFYPISILVEGKWNFFRLILIGMDILFLTSLAYYLLKTKRFRIGGLVIVVLSLAGLRFVEPGTIYFEAFHMLPWYGLLIMSTFLLLFAIAEKKALATKIIILLVVILFGYTISGSSFLWEKVDKDVLFTENYAHYYINGEVIRVLSEPNDTLFTDMWDYFIHWQAKLDSPYKYAIYTFVMRGHPIFDEARLKMFRKNPPDFYYTLCPKGQDYSLLLPQNSLNDYQQLYRDGKPACTYIKKTKRNKISQDKWNEAKKLGFSLSETKQ